jgi:hypothetical protein
MGSNADSQETFNDFLMSVLRHPEPGEGSHCRMALNILKISIMPFGEE